jgi:hypothetical protein
MAPFVAPPIETKSQSIPAPFIQPAQPILPAQPIQPAQPAKPE